MTSPRLAYAVVTPARNEAPNISRLAESLAAQTHRPQKWIVVDDRSTDDTRLLVRTLAAEHRWIGVVETESALELDRGGRTVGAFASGLEALDPTPEVIVKLDADVSFEPEYFARLLRRFEDDPKLGIASGTAFELEDGEWREQFMTGDNVWGAARAYRRECLEQVSPLELHIGWDGVDTLKAQTRGWRTATLHDLPFRHHRLEGRVHASRRRYWAEQGEMAYFMGYRPSYLLLRALRRLVGEPTALAMVPAYVRSVLCRAPRCSDQDVRRQLRRRQRLRNVPLRMLETAGRRS